MPKFFLLLFLCFAISAGSFAQGRVKSKKKGPESIFRISLLAGAYGTQLDGDNYNGYDKLGLSGGMRATALLSKHFDFDIELLYQEKGSKIETILNQERNRTINLTYVDIPLLFRYHPFSKEKGINLAAGLVFSRLISSKITENIVGYRVTYESIANAFKNNDLSLVGGVSYRFTPHLSVGGRYVVSLQRLYDNPDGVFSESYNPNGVGEVIYYLRNFMVGGYAAYTF